MGAPHFAFGFVVLAGALLNYIHGGTGVAPPTTLQASKGAEASAPTCEGPRGICKVLESSEQPPRFATSQKSYYGHEQRPGLAMRVLPSVVLWESADLQVMRNTMASSLEWENQTGKIEISEEGVWRKRQRGSAAEDTNLQRACQGRPPTTFHFDFDAHTMEGKHAYNTYPQGGPQRRGQVRAARQGKGQGDPFCKTNTNGRAKGTPTDFASLGEGLRCARSQSGGGSSEDAGDGKLGRAESTPHPDALVDQQSYDGQESDGEGSAASGADGRGMGEFSILDHCQIQRGEDKLPHWAPRGDGCLQGEEGEVLADPTRGQGESSGSGRGGGLRGRAPERAASWRSPGSYGSRVGATGHFITEQEIGTNAIRSWDGTSRQGSSGGCRKFRPMTTSTKLQEALTFQADSVDWICGRAQALAFEDDWMENYVGKISDGLLGDWCCCAIERYNRIETTEMPFWTLYFPMRTRIDRQANENLRLVYHLDSYFPENVITGWDDPFYYIIEYDEEFGDPWRSLANYFDFYLIKIFLDFWGAFGNYMLEYDEELGDLWRSMASYFDSYLIKIFLDFWGAFGNYMLEYVKILVEIYGKFKGYFDLFLYGIFMGGWSRTRRTTPKPYDQGLHGNHQSRASCDQRISTIQRLGLFSLILCLRIDGGHAMHFGPDEILWHREVRSRTDIFEGNIAIPEEVQAEPHPILREGHEQRLALLRSSSWQQHDEFLEIFKAWDSLEGREHITILHVPGQEEGLSFLIELEANLLWSKEYVISTWREAILDFAPENTKVKFWLATPQPLNFFEPHAGIHILADADGLPGKLLLIWIHQSRREELHPGQPHRLAIKVQEDADTSTLQRLPWIRDRCHEGCTIRYRQRVISGGIANLPQGALLKLRPAEPEDCEVTFMQVGLITWRGIGALRAFQHQPIEITVWSACYISTFTPTYLKWEARLRNKFEPHEQVKALDDTIIHLGEGDHVEVLTVHEALIPIPGDRGRVQFIAFDKDRLHGYIPILADLHGERLRRRAILAPTFQHDKVLVDEIFAIVIRDLPCNEEDICFVRCRDREFAKGMSFDPGPEHYIIVIVTPPPPTYVDSDTCSTTSGVESEIVEFAENDEATFLLQRAYARNAHSAAAHGRFRLAPPGNGVKFNEIVQVVEFDEQGRPHQRSCRDMALANPRAERLFADFDRAQDSNNFCRNAMRTRFEDLSETHKVISLAEALPKREEISLSDHLFQHSGQFPPRIGNWPEAEAEQEGLDFRRVIDSCAWLDSHLTIADFVEPDGLQWHETSKPWIDLPWWQSEEIYEAYFYTDGSHCPLQDGSAAVMFLLTSDGWKFGGFRTVTTTPAISSYSAELGALVMAYKWGYDLLRLGFGRGCTFHFCFDSTSAGYRATGRWQGDTFLHHVKTLRSLQFLAWNRFDCLFDGWHVKAHSGEPGNEAANSLAFWASHHSAADFDPPLQALLHGELDDVLPWMHFLFREDLLGFWRDGLLHLPDRPKTTPTEEVLQDYVIQPHQKSLERCHIDIKLTSGNVLTVQPKDDKEQQVGIWGSAREEALLRQLVDAGSHFFCFQETRHKSTRARMHKDFFLFQAAAKKGQGGIMIGISKTKAYGKIGLSKELFFQKDHFAVIHASTSRLIIRSMAPGFRCILVGCHAPHSGHDASDLQQWWKESEALIPKKYNAWPTFWMGDMNATLGDTCTSAVGDVDPLPENENGRLFHDLLLRQSLWVPSTWEGIQSGPSGTWCHPGTHSWRRLDYIALPLGWACEKAWIDEEIDLALHRQDHAAISVRASFTNEFVLEEIQAFHRKRQSSRAEGADISDHLLHVPPLRLSMLPDEDVHAHTLRLHKAILQTCTPSTSKQEGPAKASLSEATWKIICSKKQARSALWWWQRDARALLLRTTFLGWKNGHSSSADLAPLLRQQDQQIASLTLQFKNLSRQASAAVRKDNQDWLDVLCQRKVEYDDGKFSKSFWHEVRRCLPQMRQKGNGLSPLSMEILESQWVPHFAKLEAGHVVDPIAHLQSCFARQLEQKSKIHNPTLCEMPNILEVEELLRKATPGKTPGCDDVLPDFLHWGAPVISQAVHDLLCKVYYQVSEPLIFKGGRMAPIYKKAARDCADSYCCHAYQKYYMEC